MSPRYFTAPGTWDGGYYELGLEFGPISDDQLAVTVARLWAHPDLDGCYLDRQREPASQPRIPAEVAVAVLLNPAGGHLYGMATLPGGQRVACGMYRLHYHQAAPRISFYLPIGALSALSAVYPTIRHPFGNWDSAPEDPIPALDAWLAEIGRWVYAAVPFRLGLIGHEVGAEVDADDLVEIPDRRFFGYLWPQDGALEYLPRNITY